MSLTGGAHPLQQFLRQHVAPRVAALAGWLGERGPEPDPVVGLVLSGGGASASFQVGALRYLYDVVGITPTVITGTSAGSVLATLLAQADDARGQREVLDRIEEQYANLREPADLMVELDWFSELQKLVPALQRVGQARASHLEPQTITLPGLGLSRARRHPGAPGAAPPTGPVIRLPRWDTTPVRETLSAVWTVSRSRPDFETLVRGGRHEQSLYRRGPIFDRLLGPAMFDADRLARSATELRVGVVALESGELRYVTGRGVLVDRTDRPVPDQPPVPVVAAVHASCAIPAIYPPVRLGDEHYVDGATRENLPVEVAMTHLGATRCYAVNSLPSGVPVDSSYAGKDLLAIVLRAAAGIMSDEVQLDDVARAHAAGAVLIAPEVDVLGVLEVDPGLLAIAHDYGYLRAAEACEDASAAEQRVTRDLVELRRRIWKAEGPRPAGDGADSAEDDLGALKRQLRDLVARVPPGRRPPGADRWWQVWERHVVEITDPVSWVADPPPAG
ncbi:Predicted acylesterase/phospholipase RssA, contains patatin domain [Friedmanniella luteola]|uniref:Predicted acylesterase/phospholipase RssA, contains patatin domain n=1 Tax=Friedmanniella luteola TaxID=546871 RepID=A0A1H1TKC9_9ACTN|nr:patatin-like phospholipase family protein [Friedmanniella luteola]SDS60765.1 Predicted acylesterase/phospholipase RssA, contains patatin domain [Friedmanniella luteola]